MSNRLKTEPNSYNVVRGREKRATSEGEPELGRDGGRTREEVKCNRGFIVCGSVGRERSERGEKGSRTRGGDKEAGENGNSALAEAIPSGSRACSVSLQAAVFPIEQARL